MIGFSISGGEVFAPDAYGLITVELGVEASSDRLASLVGDCNTLIQKAIKKSSAGVLLHLIALQTAVYYVGCNTLCDGDWTILSSVDLGIKTGLVDIFLDDRSARERYAPTLYKIFQDYATALNSDFLSPPSSERGQVIPELGATAELFVENIAGQCGFQKELIENPAEAFLLKLAAHSYGLGLLNALLTNHQLAYIPGPPHSDIIRE